MKIAFLRYDFKGFFHNILHIITDIGQRIHGCNIHPPVPTFAIRHDVTYLIANFSRLIGHPRRHNSGKISLNLEIDTMGMRVVLPMPALRSFHSLQQVIARYLIGMPQGIFRSLKGNGKRIHRSIQTASFKDFDKCQIYIDIIIKSRKAIVPFFHHVFIPRNGNIILNNSSQEFEFGGTTITAP